MSEAGSESQKVLLAVSIGYVCLHIFVLAGICRVCGPTVAGLIASIVWSVAIWVAGCIIFGRFRRSNRPDSYDSTKLGMQMLIIVSVVTVAYLLVSWLLP